MRSHKTIIFEQVSNHERSVHKLTRLSLKSINAIFPIMGRNMTKTLQMGWLGLAFATILYSVPTASIAQETPPDPTPEQIFGFQSDFPYEHEYIEVMGSLMAYVDEGEGDPILFLHGNPTSSYLWRNIMPHVEGQGRIIAPDLIGMGKSDKPEIGYTYAEQYAYLSGFIEMLDLQNITLVVHDWGSVLGMQYARENEDNIKGLAFMEAIVAPSVPIASYEAMGTGREFFRALRTPGVGEEMILDQNVFVEVMLPEFGILRDLSDEEMANYRAPYTTRESRLPTLVWPRELPIANEPAFTTQVVTENGAWLAQTELPKLYFYAEPGALNPAPLVSYFQHNLKNIESRFIGAGVHFLQEDNPKAIGLGLSDWMRRNF